MEKPKINWADIYQRFSTKTLWHFTGSNNKSNDKSYEILLSIIRSQTLKTSEGNHKIKMPSGNKRLGCRCSCMCDIPFKDLRVHMIRYGHFGIAFHKTSAILKGYFNPVLYMHNKHPWFLRAEKLLDKLDKIEFPEEESKTDFNEFLFILGTYIKPGDLLANLSLEPIIDEEQNNNFYYEREWRTAYDFKFTEKDVAAIMMPEKYIKDFRDTINSKFTSISIIATEMILEL